MKSNPHRYTNFPLVVYVAGNSHENAASIILVNPTSFLLSKISVNKYDIASFDDIVDSGFDSRSINTIEPGDKAIIDTLSSFDLEFLCQYNISYICNRKKNNLQFTIEKYGKFEKEENNHSIATEYGGILIRTINKIQ